MRPIVRDAALVVSGVLLSGIISWLRDARRRRLANAAPTKVIQVVGDIYLDMIVSVSFEGICIIGVDRLPVITAF